MTSDPHSDTPEFERALRALATQPLALRLFVLGATPASQRAIRNVRALCDEVLRDRHSLQIVDVFQQPDLAADEGLIVAPTLVRLSPEPRIRLVGDMSDRAKVLKALSQRDPQAGS